MNMGRIFRSGIFLFIGTVVSSLLNFVFWIVISRYTSPDIIGSAAVIIALQSVLAMVFSFGLPAGLQRFVGRDAAKGDTESISMYFSTALLFLLIVNIPLVVALLYLSIIGVSLVVSSTYLVFVALLLMLSFWNPLLNSLFISLLKTEVTAIAQSISAIVRIGVGLILVAAGFSLIGILIGFAASSIILNFVLVAYTWRYLEKDTKYGFDRTRLKDLFEAGSAAWIPRMLTTIGESTGILLLFGFIGSTETGLYFIAFALGSFIYSLPASILGVMFPYLSGIGDEREVAIKRAKRLATALTIPICLIIGLYPEIPFLLIGNLYIEAAPMLSILVVGAVFVPIVSGYVSFIYANGSYRDVAAIGSISNGLRVILYYFLVSLYSGIGAAIAYTVGQIVALIITIGSARRIQFDLGWGTLAKALTLPVLAGCIFLLFGFQWYIGGPLLMIICVIVYGRTRVVTKEDLLELSLSFLSRRQVERIYVYAKPAINIIFGSD